jgi:hypothetical protein
MILLLHPNPSSHIQNPKTNKQLILQKIVILKGHNYSCSKRNNTKCPNLHKHVGMLRASHNSLTSKPRIQDRERARERERERARDRRVASAWSAQRILRVLYTRGRRRRTCEMPQGGGRAASGCPGIRPVMYTYMQLRGTIPPPPPPPSSTYHFCSILDFKMNLKINPSFSFLFSFFLIKKIEMKPLIFETSYLNF